MKLAIKVNNREEYNEAMKLYKASGTVNGVYETFNEKCKYLHWDGEDVIESKVLQTAYTEIQMPRKKAVYAYAEGKLIPFHIDQVDIYDEYVCINNNVSTSKIDIIVLEHKIFHVQSDLRSIVWGGVWRDRFKILNTSNKPKGRSIVNLPKEVKFSELKETKMQKVAIKVENENGKEIVEYLESLGYDRNHNEGCMSSGYYFGSDKGHIAWGNCIPDDIKLITLPKEKEFPRRMEVWDGNESDSAERIVLCDLGEMANYRYIGVHGDYEHSYMQGKQYDVVFWKNAKELPEFTLPEIFGHKGLYNKEDNVVIYGCMAVEVKYLRELAAMSYPLESITVKRDGNQITVTMDQIKQIIKYVDNQ